MKRITKEVERNGHVRTAYYKHMHDGSPKLVLSKNSAAELRDEDAAVIARQLNQAYGGGFEVAEA